MAHPIAPSPAARRRSVSAPAVLTVLFSALYAAFFGWLALRRYWGYEMHALDMGNMGQAAWNTIHGHAFYFTNVRLPYSIEAWNTTTRLSFHVEPLFPLISAVYLIYPHPESLIVLQTIALASGAWAVFAIARKTLNLPWLALLFAICYLLAPPLEGMNLYEFHPVALATPLLLFAWLFMIRERWLPFLLCSLAAIGTKEEMGLTVALYALYVAWKYRQRALGLGLAAFGIFWSLFATIVVEHHFRRPGTLTYTRTRFAYLGHGLHGALHTVAHDPLVFLRVIGTVPKAAYVAHMLSPFGMTSVLGAPFLALSAPTLLLNLLVTDYHMYSGLNQDSAEIISGVTIAAIFGGCVLLSVLRQWAGDRLSQLVLALLLLVGALWSQRIDGFTPLGPRFAVAPIGRHQHLEDRFVHMIPDGVPVSTQDQLDPHLSSRHYLYLFEDTGRQPPLVPADYVLLDASAPTYPLPSYQIHDRAMALLGSRTWGVQAADDGLILLRRGAGSYHIPSAFYSFADGSRARLQHPLHFTSHGVLVTGFDEAPTDMPNYRTPPLLFTFTAVRTAGAGNMRPVVYEVIGKTVEACAASPLGLAWEPTSTWVAGKTYLLRSDPLHPDYTQPATARLYLEIRPVVSDPQPTCGELWRTHGRLADLGTTSINV